jgi:hypothetical protein
VRNTFLLLKLFVMAARADHGPFENLLDFLEVAVHGGVYLQSQIWGLRPEDEEFKASLEPVHAVVQTSGLLYLILCAVLMQPLLLGLGGVGDTISWPHCHWGKETPL